MSGLHIFSLNEVADDGNKSSSASFIAAGKLKSKSDAFSLSGDVDDVSKTKKPERIKKMQGLHGTGEQRRS